MIGASLYELPPGGRTFPYHYEEGHEEWLVVVAGRPTLRTPDGDRELAPGDCVVFRAGRQGAHQVANRTDEAARVLLASTLVVPRAAFYPDSEKVRLRWAVDDAAVLHFRRADAVDYWEGE